MSTPKTTRRRAALALVSVVVVIVAALALAACGGTKTPTPLPTPTVAGTIAFSSDWTYGSPENANISLVGTDGSGLRRVIETPRGEHGPAWSPDGMWIACNVGYEDVPGVAVAKADGSDAHRLPLGKLSGECPSWSPDGQRLAYHSWWFPKYDYPPSHIFVCDADGSHQRQLTDGPDYDRYPEWTPDGQTILFLRVKSANYYGKAPGDLYSVRTDGSGLTRVTSTGTIAEFALSPDGSQLAVHDFRTYKTMLLPYGTSGSPKTILGPDFRWPIAHMSWSPDGKALVVGRSNERAYNPDVLLVVNADGSGLGAIPGVKGSDPEWQPE